MDNIQYLIMIKIIKFLLRCLLKLLYRIEITGLENYYKAGDCVLIVANHTSLLDGILLYAWLPETPTFAINTHIAAKKSFAFFLKFVDLFKIDQNNAFAVKSMAKFLSQKNKLVIFPEGRITTTGSLMKIYHGPGLVADKSAATVLAIGIDGAQFSPFSYLTQPRTTLWFPHTKLTILPPVTFNIDKNIQGHERRALATSKMQDIMYLLSYSSFNHRTTIFDTVLNAASRYGKNKLIIEDISRNSLSYKQFLIKVMILGRMMQKHTPATHLGIMMPNTTASLVTFLATHYAACIPVMINFTTNIQAVIQSCDTAKIDTIYTSRKFIEATNLQVLADALQAKTHLIYLEDIAQNISFFDKLIGYFKALSPKIHYRRIAKKILPDNPAVILFTSGSENMPKGVVLSHSNMLASYAQIASQFNFRPQDIFFSCLPLFHVFGLNVSLLLPLLTGSKVFLYSTPLHYKIIPELIYELETTILFGTNSFLKAYAYHAHPFDFHSLRYVFCGAEKMHDKTQQHWMEKFGIRIYQGYGLTETSAAFSVNNPIHNKPKSIGRPLPAINYYLYPVEGIKEGGRLFVKGPNVMSGYLRPKPRDGQIVPPESSRGQGWHDTGDIVKVDKDGYFYVLGRAKRFAKIAGEMISLTAVETLAMKVWPDFNHAAISLPDPHKGEEIILITDNQNALKKHLQEKMKKEHYSSLYLPKRILHYNALPLIGSGKTDYTRLEKMVTQEEQKQNRRLSSI